MTSHDSPRPGFWIISSDDRLRPNVFCDSLFGNFPELPMKDTPPRPNEDPDSDDDEAPETPLDEPPPPHFEDPPPEPQKKGPYTVRIQPEELCDRCR
jgi:hypothetical protein